MGVSCDPPRIRRRRLSCRLLEKFLVAFAELKRECWMLRLYMNLVVAGGPSL